VAAVAHGLADLRNPDAGPAAPAEKVWIDVESDRIRISTYVGFGIELVDRVAGLIGVADEARAAIAEDNDEFGACWVVLAARSGQVRTVHRRYLLNADPRSRRQVRLALRNFELDGQLQDPRAADVAGARAATEAALLFGVDPGPVVDAEDRSYAAYEEMGVVGGPFPWLAPLGLTWPGPDAGREFRAGSGARPLR
jgi:hypothetical protein